MPAKLHFGTDDKSINKDSLFYNRYRPHPINNMSPIIKTDTQSIEESRHPCQEYEHLLIKKEGLTAHQKSEHVGTKYLFEKCDYQASYLNICHI